jgi:uncharacterized membrane protein YgcG
MILTLQGDYMNQLARFDLGNFNKTLLGFDKMFKEYENKVTHQLSYPPYNIVKYNDKDQYILYFPRDYNSMTPITSKQCLYNTKTIIDHLLKKSVNFFKVDVKEGFSYFNTDGEHTDKVMSVLNGFDLNGRRINDEISKNDGGSRERRDHNGSSGGGFSGGSSSGGFRSDRNSGGDRRSSKGFFRMGFKR